MRNSILRACTGQHPPPWLSWAILLAIFALTAVAAAHVSVTELAAR